MSRFRVTAMIFGTAALLATPLAAGAKPYPTNVCVGRKQEVAGTYCRRVLRAWAAGRATGDAGGRDDKIERAAADLERAWGSADDKATVNGVDCADTTLGPTP